MLYELIIIGGGPAGITAGIYAARQKLNTLLITKGFGGQIGRKAVPIENYLGFPKISSTELIKKFQSHLEELSRSNFASPELSEQIKTVIDEVTNLEKKGANFLVSTKKKKKFEAKAVIIASGADPRPLEVPGEKEFISRGVSYCAVCDGPMFTEKTVAVVGGGNSGFETAIFLSNYVKKIYILESGPEVKADETNHEAVRKLGKTEIITNAAVKKIEGSPRPSAVGRGDKFVKSITYQDLKTKKMKKLAVDGVFVEVGNQPVTSFAKGLVEFNERDEIVVEFETCATKTPGLFAAGDANVGKYKQIVTAAGEGAKAALAAYDYLSR